MVEDQEVPESKEEFLKEFFKTFKAEETSVRDALGAVTEGDEVHQQLDALLLRLQALEASFTRQAHVLPAYDVQQYRSTVKALMSELAARREQLAPRKKFSFKRRTPAPGNGAAEGEKKGYAPPADENEPPAAFHGERLDGLKDVLVLRKPGELQARDVWLSNLENCRVVLLDRIGALHAQKLKGCEVLVAAVSSSALMHHCNDCVFTLSVKQLRLHDSERVALHLHSLSGPIIEHCTKISFAANDLRWPGGAEMLQEASLGNLEGNAWSEVQDFNWLKRQASPNWRLVGPKLRREGLSFGSAQEALDHFSQQQLPPALPELRIYDSCWDEGDDEF